jgi:hypothetical protein
VRFPVQSDYLAPGSFVDPESEPVRAFAHRAVGTVSDPTGKAVRLFEALRDAIWYDPFTVSTDPQTYRASAVATSAPVRSRRPARRRCVRLLPDPTARSTLDASMISRRSPAMVVETATAPAGPPAWRLGPAGGPRPASSTPTPARAHGCFTGCAPGGPPDQIAGRLRHEQPVSRLAG